MSCFGRKLLEGERGQAVTRARRCDDESCKYYAKPHNLPPPLISFILTASLPTVAIIDGVTRKLNEY